MPIGTLRTRLAYGLALAAALGACASQTKPAGPEQVAEAYLQAHRYEDALRARIREEHAKKSDVVCLIAADRDVRHGEVVRLIDLVKQEGVAKFAINIDPEALPPEAAGAVAAPQGAAR